MTHGPIDLFVEPCAGLACVSGVLQHGSAWMSAASRFGVKTKYAPATLAVLGLRPKQGARSYLWCEPEADVAALLLAQTRPDVLREAARLILEWVRDAEPFMVWNMCREALSRAEPAWGTVDAHRLACWVVRTGWTRGDRGLYVGPGAPDGINPAAGPETVARRLLPLTWPDVTVRPDGRKSWPVAPLLPPPRTFVYIDAPYRGTTPYQHKLTQTEALDIARMWASMGAVVAVAEGEPVADKLGAGWHAVDLTSARYGQARPHSKGAREWLTVNQPPKWTPPIQGSLFA